MFILVNCMTDCKSETNTICCAWLWLCGSVQVWLVGVSGAAAGFSKMGEEWVREIYAHQMHRLLSSTGPLRGISSIGTSIHGLLLVPVQVGERGDSGRVIDNSHDSEP